MTWSPSTTCRRSSTAMTRSASPSKASPTSAPCVEHRCWSSARVRSSRSPSLMFVPSGSACSTSTVGAGARRRRRRRKPLAAPLAQSRTTCSPSRRRPVERADQVVVRRRATSAAPVVTWPTAAPTGTSAPGPCAADVGQLGLERVLGRIVELAAAGREELDAVVAERVVRGRDHRPGHGRGPRRGGHGRRGQHAEQLDVAPSAVSPATRAASSSGPTRRGVAADEPRPAAEHPGRGAAEGEGELGRQLAVGDAPDTVGPERSGMARSPCCLQRLEYCGALRAFLRPYFFDSFSRASRVRKPACFSGGTQLGVELDERPGDAEAQGAGLAGPRRRRSWRRRRRPRRSR